MLCDVCGACLTTLSEELQAVSVLPVTSVYPRAINLHTIHAVWHLWHLLHDMA